MTADYTIEATPGQVAAYERDGFLVVAGPTMEQSFGVLTRGFRIVPAPTTKPCPECGGSGVELWVHPSMGAPPRETPCPACTQGTVPIVVEVVVPERACPCVGMSEDDCAACPGAIPARTLLRGTAEAVPVVDKWPTPNHEPCLYVGNLGPLAPALGTYLWLSRSVEPLKGVDVTHHFADVPRPEVGDTAWIIRGEGS